MSLKAKIEAVIYASEEPVTLAQLTGLLGHEAQAELDQMAAAQQALALEAAEEQGREAQGGEDQVGEEQGGEEQGGQAAVLDESVAEEASPEAEESDGPVAKESEDTAAKVDTRQERERARRLREYFRELLEELVRDYATPERGLEVREVAGGYRLATKPEYHDAVRGFVKSLKPPLKLSLQALETLAVVAYKQPVTAPEISEIRGVDSGGVLGSLMARKLITTAGRKQVIGRPILYKTTKDFLLRFGLKDIGELPSIEEFEKIAGELAEQEEIPMSHEDVSHEGTHDHHAPETAAELEEERDSVEPQADGDSEGLTPDTVPVDGRISGPPPNYDEADDTGGEVDSPAMDAKIQGQDEKEEGQ